VTVGVCNHRPLKIGEDLSGNQPDQLSGFIEHQWRASSPSSLPSSNAVGQLSEQSPGHRRQEPTNHCRSSACAYLKNQPSLGLGKTYAVDLSAHRHRHPHLLCISEYTHNIINTTDVLHCDLCSKNAKILFRHFLICNLNIVLATTIHISSLTYVDYLIMLSIC
jgi:hypothetical protein